MTPLHEHIAANRREFLYTSASGLGLALLPELSLLSDVSANNSVRRIEVEDWSASRSIAAVWRRGSPLEAMFAEIAERIAHEARATLEGVAG